MITISYMNKTVITVKLKGTKTMKEKIDLNNLPSPQDRNILGTEKITRKTQSPTAVFRFHLSDEELEQAKAYIKKNDIEDIPELTRLVLKRNGVT